MKGKVIVNAQAAIMAMALSRSQYAGTPDQFIPQDTNNIHRRGKFKQSNRKSKKG